MALGHDIFSLDTVTKNTIEKNTLKSDGPMPPFLNRITMGAFLTLIIRQCLYIIFYEIINLKSHINKVTYFACANKK